MSNFLAELGASHVLKVALLLGAAAALIGAAAKGFVRRAGPVPLGGALFAAAALTALTTTVDLPWLVAAGAGLLVVGAWLGREPWEVALGSLPGAAAIVYAGSFSAGPAVALALAISVAAALVVDFDRSFAPSAAGTPLLAVSTVGILVTVPDIERALALVGAALPLALAGWPFPLVSLGAGAAAAVGVIGWVAGDAGVTRPGAAVGALTALGLMMAEPIGRRVGRVSRTALARLASSGPRGVFVMGVIHGVIVLGTSRVAGLQQSALVATAIALPILALGAVVGAAPAGRRRAARTGGSSSPPAS